MKWERSQATLYAHKVEQHYMGCKIEIERPEPNHRKKTHIDQKKRDIYTTHKKKCLHAQIGMSFVLAHSFTWRIYTPFIYTEETSKRQEEGEKKKYSIV